MKKYNIGLDIGTSSVGWAVVEPETQKIIRKGNKPLWGVRLFETASTAEGRRGFRSTRRRYARRKERIALLQKEFYDEINKVDSHFFEKLEDTKYSDKDPINKKFIVSEEDKKKIIQYNKDYKTIYHLRKELVENTDKKDIRLVYLAIHHIIKYRGNFLYNSKGFNTENLNVNEKIKDAFDMYFNLVNPELSDDNILDYDEISEELMNKSKIDMKKNIKDILKSYGIFDSKFIDEFVKMISGGKFEVNKFLSIEDAESKKSISFDGTDFDDNYDEIEKICSDKIEVLTEMKNLYDTLFLKKLFKGSKYNSLSSLMVGKYNEHKNDLKFLKELFRADKKTFKDFFKSSKKYTCIYDQYITNKMSYEDFDKKIRSSINDLKNIQLSDEYYNNMLTKLNNGEFIPRITSSENGKYPYQLNESELIKIIENQGKYYPFLLEKLDGTYRIVKLLQFRIPYFVGPLTNEKNSRYAWLERKEEGIKITPFNFDEVVDKEKTAEKFILRMISKCTYLLNEEALPNNSIMYNKFKVMNELKQIKINGTTIENKIQHKIIKELFMKKSGKISDKTFKDYILSTNDFSMYNSELTITGYSSDEAFANNMQSYIDFFGEDGIFKETDYSEDDAENIIKWITIFDDKDILEKKVRDNYSKLNENQIKKIITKKYKGWGSLSSKLLNTKYYVEKDSGIKKSILDLMYETKENFMQIINNDKYKFQKMIAEFNDINNDNGEINYKMVESLATSPANKRGIYQALKIVKEIVSYMKSEPQNIMIEMAREDGEKKRTLDRKKYLEKLYTNIKEQAYNHNKLINELKEQEKIDSQKLYLYFIQEGKCLYCGEPLNVNDLKDYEVDHLIPRTLIKDDSIDNKSLVHLKCNHVKAANYILPSHFRTKENHEWWKHLKKVNLISAKKYHNLIRKEYSKEDIEGFINRQLVETRQITKHVANILKTYYKDTNVIYLKANLSHNYRERFDLFKFREINDYHHAHDAYLAAVLGEYKEYYLKKNINFEGVSLLNKSLIEQKNYKQLRYGYVINSLDENVNEIINTLSKNCFDEETGEVKFNASKFNDNVENTLYRNDIMISRKPEIRTGEYWNQTKSKKGNKGITLKKNMPTEIYGSYTSVNPAYAIMVKITKGNKMTQKLVGYPIFLVNNKNNQLEVNYYQRLLGLSENDKYEFISKPIPFYSLLNWDGQLCYLVGASDKIEVCNATEFNYDKEFFKNHKYSMNKLFNKSKIEILDTKYENDLEEILKYITNKIEKEYKLYNNLITELKEIIKYDDMSTLTIEDKENMIIQLTKLLNIKSECANFQNYGHSLAFGKKNGRIIEKSSVITKSVTGIQQHSYVVGK